MKEKSCTRITDKKGQQRFIKAHQTMRDESGGQTKKRLPTLLGSFNPLFHFSDDGGFRYRSTHPTLAKHPYRENS